MLRTIVSRPLLVLSCFVLGAAVAAGASYLMTPIYRSEVLVSPAQSDQGGLGRMLGQLGGIGALAGINLPNEDSEKQVWLAMLTSRSFTADFIQSNNLMPVLYENRWDAANKRWKSSNPKRIPSLADAVQFFDRDVRKVSEDRKSGLVTLTIDWKDRELAAKWANEHIQRVNRAARAKAVHDAETSIKYLEAEIGKTSVVELRQAIFRLIESQINRIVMANVNEEYAFKVVDAATVPDPKQRVRPNRPLLVIAGAFAGLLLGVILAMHRGGLLRIAPRPE